MIVVTGSTGALNGATTEHLLMRMPAQDIAVVVRDPAKARHFADRGVEVRRGDYTDRRSLDSAFEGADQLLVVSTNAPADEAAGQHRTVIDAAVAVGVGRIVYTSHQGAAADSSFAYARSHAATESMLETAEIPWTSLRNGFYTETLPWLMGSWQETGVIEVPADGPVSWTSRADAAEAAAVILTADEPRDGVVTITAGEAPTFAEVAKIASQVVGRDVGYRLLDEGEWVETQVRMGQPEGFVRLNLGIYQAARDGFFAGIDPILGTLLRRPPVTVRLFLEGVSAA